MPDTISPLHLPPYAPELNPVETVWAYLRGNTLGNSIFDTYDTIVERCCHAWTGSLTSQTASKPSDHDHAHRSGHDAGA